MAEVISQRFPSESTLPDGRTVIVREIEPGDADAWTRFLDSLSPGTRYKRAARKVEDLTAEAIAAATAPDPAEEVALVAVIPGSEPPEIAGVARLRLRAPRRETGELLIVVGDRWQRKGLGEELVKGLIVVGRSRGLAAIDGAVLATNRGMLTFVERLGFRVEPAPGAAHLKRIVLGLR